MPNLEVLVSPQDLIALRSIYGHQKYIEESFHVHMAENVCIWRFPRYCSNELSRDDQLITLNVMRERRELDGVSWWIVLPTYTLFLFVYVYA